jgi:hypothetical protein
MNMMVNSSLMSQPMSMNSGQNFEQSTQADMVATRLSQIQRVLKDNNETEILNSTIFGENDPTAARLLDEVLESLRFRNEQSKKVDGQISDFMNPDVSKIKKII